MAKSNGGGRPAGYGAKEKRKLHKFLFKRFLAVLSDNPDLITEGRPVAEDDNAYFDADALHIAFIDHTGFAHLSAWQTSNALTQLGIKTVRRRFGGGERRVVRVLPMPKGSVVSQKGAVDRYLDNMPKFALGAVAAERHIKAKTEFKKHGLSRRAKRMFYELIAEYPIDEREQLEGALSGEGVTPRSMIELDERGIFIVGETVTREDVVKDRIMMDFYKRLRVGQCTEPGYEDMVEVFFVLDHLGGNPPDKKWENGAESGTGCYTYASRSRHYEYYEQTFRREELWIYRLDGQLALGYTPERPGEHPADQLLQITDEHPVARLMPPKGAEAIAVVTEPVPVPTPSKPVPCPRVPPEEWAAMTPVQKARLNMRRKAWERTATPDQLKARDRRKFFAKNALRTPDSVAGEGDAPDFDIPV